MLNVLESWYLIGANKFCWNFISCREYLVKSFKDLNLRFSSWTQKLKVFFTLFLFRSIRRVLVKAKQKLPVAWGVIIKSRKLEHFAWEMNPNHTITMNAQPMQRRPYINPRGGAISRNMNHRMQRFGQQQQPHHNHRGNGGINNQNKDLIECFNGNNSHGWVYQSLSSSSCLIPRFT